MQILSGVTIPGQSDPVSNDNEGVFSIPQSSEITGTSPSDLYLSCQDTHCGVLPYAERQSVYSTAPAVTGQGSIMVGSWKGLNGIKMTADAYVTLQRKHFEP